MMTDTRIAFVGHVLFYSAFPVYFASLRSSMRLIFLYAYISVVLVVGGFLGSVYALPLSDEVAVSAGSVSYGALMFSAVLLVVVGRNLQVIRNTVKIIVAVNVFKIGLFAIMAAALGSALYPSPYDTSSEVFSVSIRLVVIGGALIIIELLILIAAFERIKQRVENVTALSALYVGFFILVLCLDGVLFPLTALPTTPGLGDTIVKAVIAKFWLATAFAVPLTAFLIAFRGRMAQYEATPLRLHELFFAPTEDLIDEIERQQAALATSEERYRQLTDSLGEPFFSLDRELRVTTWNVAAQQMIGLSAGKRARQAPRRDPS